MCRSYACNQQHVSSPENSNGNCMNCTLYECAAALTHLRCWTFVLMDFTYILMAFHSSIIQIYRGSGDEIQSDVGKTVIVVEGSNK